jgi:hypothetical protein
MSITIAAAPIWATTTNFASGPAVGTPTRVDLGGAAAGLIPGNTLPAQQFNFVVGTITDYLAAIRTAVSGIAVDGVAGGTYTLTNPLIFDGDAVQIDGLFDIASGGQGQISSGGLFTVASGGVIDVISGGTVEFNASADLKIDDALDAFRLTLTPLSIPVDGGGVPTWSPRFSGSVHSGYVAGWQQDDVSGAFSIAFPINLPAGDEILQVQVSVNGSSTSGTGGHASKPVGGDLPSVALVRVDTTGTAVVVARRADQAADVTVYNADHTITLENGSTDAGTMPHVVGVNDTYFVVVKGEGGANAVAGEFCVTAVSGDVVARSYRSALMTY